jgi:sugar phosphate permease
MAIFPPPQMKDLVGNWALLYFSQYKELDPADAALMLLFFECGGIIGGMLAGLISDKVFDGRRNPICFLYSLGLAATAAVLPYCESPWVGGRWDLGWDLLLFARIGNRCLASAACWTWR